MPIKNYTTTIDAFKTASEIEKMLVEHGALSIMKTYENGQISGISFMIDTGTQTIPVRLPAKIEECLDVMKKEKQQNPKAQIKLTKDQARKVAWRILKDWVDVQLALLDMKMVSFEEIFLSYIETQDGKTIYEKLEERKFCLEQKEV